MIIIFQCYGGTHTSVATASLYLGRLPRTRAPQLSEVLALPYFDRVGKGDIGELNYLGRDRRDNPVFALGSIRWGAEIRAVLAALTSLPPPAGQQGRTFLSQSWHEQTVAVIDCLPTITWPVRLGGFLSRRLGLTIPGRPLAGWGIIRSYPRYLALVERFEEDPGPYLL